MKKLKKSLAALLSVLMMTTLLTVNTFAEGDEPVTPDTFDKKSEEVQKDLADAVEAEVAAGVVGLVTGNDKVVQDETVAEINDLLAIDAIELAQRIEDAKQKELDRDAKYAEGANENAQEALGNSDQAYKDAYNAETREEAKDAAEDAFVAASVATVEANKAALAYAEAQKDYAITVAEIEAALAGGLITAEEAKKRTEQAAEALKPAYEAATAAKGDADAAFNSAAEAADNAKKELNEKAEALEAVIADKAPEILLGTVEVAGLDAALIAADAAVALTNRTVERLEDDIAINEQAILTAKEELDASINEITTLLNQFYNGLDSTGKKDSDIKELKSALDALNKSKYALATQLTYEQVRKSLEENADYIAYTEAKGNLLLNTSTNKNEDIRKVTEYVIKNTYAIRNLQGDVIGANLDLGTYNKFANYKWAEGSEYEGKNVLQLKDGYYEVKLDDKGNVQLYSLDTKLLNQKYSDAINLDSKLNEYEQNLVNAKTNNAEKTSNLIQTISSKTAKLQELSATGNKAEALLNSFNANEEILVGNSEKIDELTNTLNKLNNDLNGGLIDKLVRSGLTNPTVKNYLENPTNENLTLALRSVTDSTTRELLNNLGNINASVVEDGKTLIDLITTIGSGDLSAENVLGAIQDITSLLANNKVSEKTKQAFTTLIQEVIQDKRNEVLMDLEINIEAVEQATSAVATATAKVAAKDIELAKAAINKAQADAQYADAAIKYNIALNAAEKASAAYEAYKELMRNPNVDKTNLNRAKDAYEAARSAEQTAWGNYFDAKRILDVVFNNRNQNAGVQDSTIAISGKLDPSKRHDIVVNYYNLNAVRNDDLVITDKTKAFAVNAYVVEDGKPILGPVVLDQAVSFKVLVPSKILNADLAPGTNTRGYKVTRIHDGDAQVIETNLHANSLGEITISSNKFSIYVIEAHDYYVPVNYTIHKEVVKTSAN